MLCDRMSGRVCSRLGAVVVAALFPALLSGCLPSVLDGRPPSFSAFLRRNGMVFDPVAPPLEGPTAATIGDIARTDGPFPASAVNPPVYGALSCPVACSGAVLSQRGETVGVWFVSYPGTRYGNGDIAWVLIDPTQGVRVTSTSHDP